MSKTRYLSLITLVALSLTGCYTDNEEELYGIEICNPDSVSYRLHIVPIVQSHCFKCHSNKNAPSLGDNITLEGHFNLKAYADNGELLKAIKHLPPVEPMPKNGSKLSNCNISVIETWILDGTKNN